MLRVVSIVGMPDQFGNLQFFREDGTLGEDEYSDAVTEEGF